MYIQSYIQTIFAEPKFLGSIDNHIFLPMVLRCMRARAPVYLDILIKEQIGQRDNTLWLHVCSLTISELKQRQHQRQRKNC